MGWGRTDAGVHANGAVCTIDLSIPEIQRLSNMAPSNHLNELNVTSEALIQTAATLQSALKEFACGRDHKPGSISAQRCTPVPPTFDARFSCVWKRYVYIISCSKTRSPFLSRYAWEMDTMLHYNLMVQASTILSGRHDFSWLSVIQPGDKMNPVRDLKLTLEMKESMNAIIMAKGANQDGMTSESPPSSYWIEISATCDFFLYKMVRRIVGVLVAIGSERVDLKDLEACVVSHDDDDDTVPKRKALVPKGLIQTAPAHGLRLDHIEYDIIV